MTEFIHSFSFSKSKAQKNLKFISLSLVLFQSSVAMEPLPPFSASSFHNNYSLSEIKESALTSDIDEIDKIAINHSILSYHAYERHLNKHEWDPNNPKLGPSKQWSSTIEDIKQDWTFYDVDGKTGFDLYLCPSLVALVGYNPNLNMMTIAYRGSQKLSDWANNLNSSRCAPEGVLAPFDLHAGYVEVFEHSKDSLLRTIGKALSESTDNTKKELTVLCTGHSLGGATATIAAYYLADQHYFSNIHLRVFASPPIGSSSFNNWMQKHLASAKVFTRETDVFPSWSPSCIGLTLIGKQILLPSYGDSATSHQISHDNRKYRRGIYEALGIEYIKLYRRFIVYPFGIITEW